MTKITFLCGSLEPGRDGVGDYTRLLAGELVRQGHQVCIAALNDRHTTTLFDDIQSVNGVDLSVLRLPASLPETERFGLLKEFVDKFAPDWISLQYVPFSFHIKGVPWRLHSHLLTIGKAYRWHIMFHELWVGHAHRWNESHFWYGRAQKLTIKKLIRSLRTSLLTTQAPYYQYLLGKEGITADIVPLFGNVPIATVDPQTRAVRGDEGASPVHQQTAVIFGSIPADWSLRPLLDKWRQYLAQTNKQGRLLLMGKHGRPVDDVLSEIQRDYPAVKAIVLGQLPEHELSLHLQTCDFGIVPVPRFLIEKSGAATAMLEHGLPVIATRAGQYIQTFNYKNKDPLIHFLPDMRTDDFNNLTRGTVRPRLSLTAKVLSDWYESR